MSEFEHWICEENLREIESDLKRGFSWTGRHETMCLANEIRLLQRQKADLIAACEAWLLVSLEGMGFRSYAKIEQEAIDLMIDALKRNKDRGGDDEVSA